MCGSCDSFIVLEPFASGSRSGVGRMVVTPKEILPFVYICVYVYAYIQRLCRCRRSAPIYALRFFSLPLPPCAAAFSDLSLTRPFCYSALLVPLPVLPGALFCVKPPPRGTHTRRQRSEGTGPTEDRKDNVNAASISSLPPVDSANEMRKRRRLSNFESNVQR